MQPSRLQQPLFLVKGGTFRQTFFLQQPALVYKAVTGSLPATPVELIVPGHGLQSGQPVWIEGVQNVIELNTPYAGPPIYAEVVDPDTLRFSAVSGIGKARAQGGQVIYQMPMDLTGCTARFEVVTPEGEFLFDAATTVEPNGQISVLITDAETAALTWERAKFRLWLTMSNGDVDSWLVGELLAREAW